MYLLINLLIFVFMLFIYIHVYFHITPSNYLEIYETINVSKNKFEDLCNLKQPIIFKNISIINWLDIAYILNNYSNFDVKVINRETNNNMYIYMNFKNLNDLLKLDVSGNYISQYNEDFLRETSLIKEIENNDTFLRPYNLFKKEYDLIMGSKDSYTNMKYVLNNRNYLNLLSGSVEITLSCPKDNKYLYVKNDYERLEFISDIDMYNINDIHKNDFNKVKLLRIILEKDMVIQIPPYWCYSIKFLEENTVLLNCKYFTYMNYLSVVPDLFLNLMQKHNVKENFTKIITDKKLG